MVTETRKRIMELIFKLGTGYVMHRLCNELKAHPRIVNLIILGSKLPEQYKPDPDILNSILKTMEEEKEHPEVETYCFSCSQPMGYRINPIGEGESHMQNGFFICQKCGGVTRV